MQRVLLIGQSVLLLLVMLLLSAGCQTLTARKNPARGAKAIDDPRLTREEQERRARELLHTPENSPTVGPRTFVEFPGR